jgi:arsenate reductase (thioredoxin)
MNLTNALSATISELITEFNQIPAGRKPVLTELTQFVQDKVVAGKPAYLNFICTHNSRRSHLSQLWAQAAAYYYGVPDVHCYSGGTEATAFNPRAVKAMRDVGFSIEIAKGGDNPAYDVIFANDAPAIKAFSKKYDDAFNHNHDFAAVMTCSHADENCPVVLGAVTRIALRYDDPKEYDGTDLEAAKYAERARQIGREILFAFAHVKKS